MIIFVVPAFNEEANIRSLLLNLKERMAPRGDYKVIVVNDGSTDRTREIVESFAGDTPVRLVNFETNRGVGEAFRAGFQEALRLACEGDIVVTKEADNTSDLGILDEMLSKIDQGYDLVLASCYARGGKVVGTTWWRQLLSVVANLLLKTLFPIPGVNTYSSFYRACRSEALRRGYQVYGDRFITEDGFVCVVEVLIKLARLSARISEVPLILKCDLRKGASKMKIAKTIRDYLRFCLRHRLSGS